MPRASQTLFASLFAAAVGGLVAAPAAPAATRLVIKGAGFGHGVGMSQYGAYGFAVKGTPYDKILTHYYRGTSLGTLTSNPDVTVLLRSSKSAAFTGAARIGERPLDPAKTYSTIEEGGRVVLRSPGGRALVMFAGAVRISGPGGAPVKLLGRGPNAVRDGRFRGALEFRPAGGGLLVINAVNLEDYVRGVVAGESPASWPAEALRAQAVAARTYALATSKNGDGFQQYADTRSQVYNGVTGERPTTDAAVAATSRRIVTFLGKPIVTYFFSTSGGKTENVEVGFPGATPQPYLRGVEDPYDNASPRHRWGPYRLTLAQAERKLGGLVKGRFRSIKVTKRGFSPRIVSAEIVGTRGITVVNGPTLRARLGLFDSWATFTTIGAKVATPPAEKPAPGPAPGPSPGPGPAGPAGPTGGASPDGASLRAASFSAAAAAPADAYRKVLVGHVAGAGDGDWIRVQRSSRSGGWANAFWTSAQGRNGRYRATLPGPGTYRVQWRGFTGPSAVAR